MREFNYRLDKGLLLGLRPYENLPAVEQSLSRLENFKVGQVGIEPILKYEQFKNDDKEASWPYPQLFEGSQNILIVYDDVLYLNLTVSGLLLNENLNTLIDQNGDTLTAFIGTAIDISSNVGSAWSFVDYGKFFFLANDKGIVYTDTSNENVINPPLKFAKSLPKVPLCRSYCNYKGQLIGGGVLSNWHGCGKNSIVWGKIGEFNMTPEVSMESGFKNVIEWNGVVHQVLRLYDIVIVYGDEGILSLFPAGNTFGFHEVAYRGLLSRYSVAGDVHEHIFIDSNYVLWRMSIEGTKARHESLRANPIELGYTGYMKKLNPETLWITKDRNRRDYFISDGEITYLLSERGLSQVTNVISFPIRMEHIDVANITIKGNTAGIIEGSFADISVRGFKTIVAIELGGSKVDGVSVGVKYKIPRSTTEHRSPLVPVNNEGIGYIKVTCTDFAPVVVVQDPSDYYLSYINMRLNLTDNRSIRGFLDVNEIGKS